MDNEELQKKLDEIRKGMKWIDSIIHIDYKTEEAKLTKKQVDFIKKLFSIFEEINWKLSFNNYKELKYEHSDPIKTQKCGTPVQVRSCKKEHGDKTYFGILLGDMALSISHSIDKDNIVIAKRTFYNPAIFVPELNDILYGCSSWWRKIENENDLKKLITEDVIKNVWYVKFLNYIDKLEMEKKHIKYIVEWKYFEGDYFLIYAIKEENKNQAMSKHKNYIFYRAVFETKKEAEEYYTLMKSL